MRVSAAAARTAGKRKLGHLHRHLVVFGLIAEGAGHAAAGGSGSSRPPGRGPSSAPAPSGPSRRTPSGGNGRAAARACGGSGFSGRLQPAGLGLRRQEFLQQQRASGQSAVLASPGSTDRNSSRRVSRQDGSRPTTGMPRSTRGRERPARGAVRPAPRPPARRPGRSGRSTAAARPRAGARHARCSRRPPARCRAARALSGLETAVEGIDEQDDLGRRPGPPPISASRKAGHAAIRQAAGAAEAGSRSPSAARPGTRSAQVQQPARAAPPAHSAAATRSAGPAAAGRGACGSGAGTRSSSRHVDAGRAFALAALAATTHRSSVSYIASRGEARPARAGR